MHPYLQKLTTNFLHYDLPHPKSLKLSQALRIKRICFETSEAISKISKLL